MSNSNVFRMPSTDMAEIRKIASELNINLSSAYQIWKKKNMNLNISWKNI